MIITLKTKAVCAGMAIMLGASAIAPVAAMAADTTDGTATTQAYIKADSSKVLASAPTEIHLAVDSDGTLIVPDAASTTLENKSTYAIHVSDITSKELNSFNLDTGNDLVSLDVQANATGDAVNMGDCLSGKAVSGTQWNMSKKSGATSTIPLTLSGSMSNITKDLAQEANFGSISWTFAPGSLTA